ncbi:unnamed protein product [Spirodela intermedia]|uniref:Ninja-family protein n=1 Tax=Spirodela intermedia TaxID=51605 RepID=A0A7I8JVZ1_SPIIN|nr:unnamed protein product [Spirodela intermedia]
MAEAKDLLRGLSGDFTAAVFPAAAEEEEENSGEVELTLGLSLGGCFSGEPGSRKGTLLRSSSIAFLPSLQQGKEDSIAMTAALARTSSLPVETEEEQRKRKELQYLRRLEAKRKRSEKRINSRSSARNRAGGEDQQQEGNKKAAGDSAAAAGEGSQGPQGSSSSVVSDFDHPPPPTRQGSGAAAGASNGGGETLPATASPEKTVAELRGMMEEMPCVFTVGGGGRRVEGFLYRYRKGEEVRIVCVCHGRFFSPAEFVEHAGGGVVAHPLRHIVVNPSPAGF